MESLGEETWDVVIAGTGLPQALLALSLSRSNLKILHVDKNNYYGGVDAGLSLNDIRDWAKEQNEKSRIFSQISIVENETSNLRLSPSRAYTLSLTPQIIYAQSTFLPSLVSSQINSQLEFLAVGSWWILQGGIIKKIPSNREDVFADDTLESRQKRALMKFLRYCIQDQDEGFSEDMQGSSLAAAFNYKFKIPNDLHSALLALALAPKPANATSLDEAVARIKRHIQSIGYFGPGFGAVTAKYGGNAEICQVACRAGAVGGAVYLLGYGISSFSNPVPDETPIGVTLTGGTTIKTRFLVGSDDDLPSETTTVFNHVSNTSNISQWHHRISIVSNPLKTLFPQTSDGGPVPAVAIVMVDNGSDEESPIYLQIHSEDTGECPTGQCLVYASIEYGGPDTLSRLESAIEQVLTTTEDEQVADVLWSVSYISTGRTDSKGPPEPVMFDSTRKLISFSLRRHDMAFDDGVLESIKVVWNEILADQTDGLEFMRFEDRGQTVEDDI